MEKYANQRLLVLGSNVGAPEIVKYARANDAYVIVADYLPASESSAKPLANRAVQISTGDVELLSHLVVEERITAVMAGISEFNILRAIELADNCGLPFYCTRAQWDAVGRKDQFRSMCEYYSVPCPQTWFLGAEPKNGDLASIEYPVVVKPVDSSASLGVTFCGTAGELHEAIIRARHESSSGQIIIESLVMGEEFTVHYTINQGRARISTMDNRHGIRLHTGVVTSIPVARTYPSSFLTEFLAQVDPAMVRLCEGLGIKNGVLFAQGIYDRSRNSFIIFEGGLRPAGEATWRLVEQANGINPWHLMIDQCVLGEATYDINKEDPRLSGKIGAVVSLVGRGGTVGEISGISHAVREAKSIFDWESRYSVGSLVPDGDSLRQLMIRFAMLSDTVKGLALDIDKINSLVRVLDDSGHDMCFRFDIKRLGILETSPESIQSGV